MLVIPISGKAGHGKDTVAELIRLRLESDGKSVLVTHYADLLKYICRTFFGWNGEKDEAGRRLLQVVGTDIIRKEEPDFWVAFVIKILTMFRGYWDYVLIPDCRFPNEITYLREAGLQTLHVSVFRPNYEGNLTEEQKQHPSETALDDTEPDVLIINDGTIEQLSEDVVKFVKDLEEMTHET